jgi:hypothetical protein
VSDPAWDLASVIVEDETRATAVAAAMTHGESVTLTTLPLSAHADDIRRAWRQHGGEGEPPALEREVVVIFDRLGCRVREALARGGWDWGDRPPASFASWLTARLGELRDAERSQA